MKQQRRARGKAERKAAAPSGGTSTSTGLVDESGRILGVVAIDTFLQWAYVVLLLLMVALRNDFPFNVTVMGIAVFYSGFLLCVHVVTEAAAR